MYGIRPIFIAPRRSNGGEASSRGHRVAIEDAQDVVEGIALGWSLSGGANQVEDVVEAKSLSGVCAGLVVNLFADDSALEIIDAKGKRCLREKRRHHDPVRLDVIEVVEKKPPNSKITKVVESGRRGSLSSELDAELVVVRVIRERDVREEPAGLVLEIAQHAQMVDAVLKRFDVSVEHGAVRSNPEAMR